VDALLALRRLFRDIDRAFPSDRRRQARKFGPDRVVEPIGVGGTGTVHRAVNDRVRRPVAIKVVSPRQAADPGILERLRREGVSLRRVHHANVVGVLGLGEGATDRVIELSVVLEWLPDDLEALLRGRRPSPLPPATALSIARGVADGLAAIHAAGFVHRDVKPANILLRADGSPVLADFGLVRELAAPPERRVAPSTVIVGTTAYLAPEQIRGEDVDGRADLYALGVVLDEMLTGRVPFARGDSPNTLLAHRHADPPPLSPAVPEIARSIVARALRERPADRFPSASAMAAALAEATDSRGERNPTVAE
jgi:serine/threonine protein kinase